MSTSHTTETHHRFSSLTEWSQQHIRDIFEATSDGESMQAISLTFSEDVTASVNSMPLNKEGITQLVKAMRASAPNGLKVDWFQTVEAPLDEMNSVSHFSTQRPKTVSLCFICFCSQAPLGESTSFEASGVQCRALTN
jgi:hypothetical protein